MFICASALLSINKAYAATMSISEDVNLRSEPYTASSIVGTLSVGEQVEVLGNNGNWVEISAADKHGFVFHTFLNSMSMEQPNVNVSDEKFATILTPVYMRSSANNTGQIVKTLESGTQVKVLASEGNWFKVSVDNLQGYVYRSYLDFVSSPAEQESVVSLESSP